MIILSTMVADPSTRDDRQTSKQSHYYSHPRPVETARSTGSKDTLLTNGASHGTATSANTNSSWAIKEYLEGLMRDQIQAINDRWFDHTSPIWHYKASFFRAEIGFLSDARLTLTEWVNSWRALAKEYPDYHMRCCEMSTYVDEDNNVAEIFCMIVAEGMPPGIQRPGYSTAHFKVVQNKWVAVRYKTMNAPEGI